MSMLNQKNTSKKVKTSKFKESKEVRQFKKAMYRMEPLFFISTIKYRRKGKTQAIMEIAEEFGYCVIVSTQFQKTIFNKKYPNVTTISVDNSLAISPLTDAPNDGYLVDGIDLQDLERIPPYLNIRGGFVISTHYANYYNVIKD